MIIYTIKWGMIPVKKRIKKKLIKNIDWLSLARLEETDINYSYRNLVNTIHDNRSFIKKTRRYQQCSHTEKGLNHNFRIRRVIRLLKYDYNNQK